jgi:hypothetical protein
MKQLFIIFLFLPTTLSSQILDTYINSKTKNEICKIYIEDCIKNNYNLEIDSTSDTLIIIIQGNEKVELRCTFNVPYYKKCDYEELIIYCNQCIEKHISDVINYKPCQWKKISENRYLSNFRYKSEMNIFYNTLSDKCLIIIFKLVKAEKKEYKKKYNSL